LQKSIESEILHLIESLKLQQQVDIGIIWVPGHTGITGNERADYLAKRASEKSEIDIKPETTIQEIYSKIDSVIYAEWQQNYTNSSTAPTYKHLEPIVNKDIKYMENNRRKETMITRLRLGKCLLNMYLHKIGRHDTGLCETCRQPETVEHFLLNCKVSNIFHQSEVKTMQAAFSTNNIDIIYKRIKDLKRKI